MKILLSSNKEIIKEYIAEKSKIGFIPTASELEPLLSNYNAMNLVDFYILPHYNSKEKYTHLADEIEENIIIINL